MPSHCVVNWNNGGSGPETWSFWQNLLRQQAGLSTNASPDGRLMPEIFYDPVLGKPEHPWGTFGANDGTMSALGGPASKASPTSRGTSLASLSSLSQKVIVASAKDAPSSRYKGSWYFEGPEWVGGSGQCQPDPRHGGKTLCLFADGHTEPARYPENELCGSPKVFSARLKKIVSAPELKVASRFNRP